MKKYSIILLLVSLLLAGACKSQKTVEAVATVKADTATQVTHRAASSSVVDSQELEEDTTFRDSAVVENYEFVWVDSAGHVTSRLVATGTKTYRVKGWRKKQAKRLSTSSIAATDSTSKRTSTAQNVTEKHKEIKEKPPAACPLLPWVIAIGAGLLFAYIDRVKIKRW